MGYAKRYREIAKQAIDTLNAVGMMLEGSKGGALIRTASGASARLVEVDRERAAAKRRAADEAEPAALPVIIERTVEVEAKPKPAAKAGKAEKVETIPRSYKPAPPEHEPELRGHSPRGMKAKKYRLIGIDPAGEKTGFVDEGTAAELAERNDIGPSTVYKAANSGKPAGRYIVEKVG